MPNIEIHAKGFQVNAAMVKMAIDAIMKEIGLEKEAITTIIDSTPESCESEPKLMPFIRVCASDVADIDKIVQAFKAKKLGIDVETLLLHSFIPRDEMW